jgi:hypothetical protein
MKFGIREVTDVVFKTKNANQQVGSTTYSQPSTPVLVIDSAKMTSVENAVATVYAQGGKGNPRLLAWDGDRTAVFKVESAIISNDSLAMLAGADIVNNATAKFRQQYAFTSPATGTAVTFTGTQLGVPTGSTVSALGSGVTFNILTLDISGDITGVTSNGFTTTQAGVAGGSLAVAGVVASTDYIIDFYVEAPSRRMDVEAGKFAGYYYVEANTLFRDLDGVDHPAQITIPKAKLKSNFTISMSPTGDPSTFTLELDALPDTTNFVTDKKVLYAVDIATLGVIGNNLT